MVLIPERILVLGGTVFVGRAISEAARDRGHQVTVFHRGSKGAGLIPGVDEILGDRDGGLSALGDRTWDLVIDTCGYVPRLVRDSSDLLKDRADWYGFISTISIYEEADGQLREPTREAPDTEEVTGETYGPLKFACEKAVAEAFSERSSVIRPGLIAGPYDPTYRFPYWVDRAMSGEPFLVPEDGASALQQIDARDLAGLVLDLAERRAHVTADAVGEKTTFAATLAEVLKQHPGAQPRSISAEQIATHQIAYWQDLPILFPPDSEGTMMMVDDGPALALGLKRRPFSETARDVADWLHANPVAQPTRFGMSREREREILAALDKEFVD